MSDPNQPSTPAGWYPDGQGGQRWWDGSKWTEHTQPGGQAPPAAPEQPKAPGADLPTQVAPNRAADYPAGGGQGGAPQGGYGAPQGQPYGAPQGQPAGGYGQPGQPGHPGGAYGQPGQPGGHGQPFGQGSTGATGSSGGGNGKKIAIIGGAVAALVLLLVLAFVVLGALFGGGPKDVAEEYLDAAADGDVEAVCDLSSKKTQEQEFESYDVDSCGDYADAIEGEPEFEEFEKLSEDFEVDYEIGDVKENDDTAEVKFTSTTEYTGDDEAFEDLVGEEETEGTVFLVKEDGDWKVDGDRSDGL